MILIIVSVIVKLPLLLPVLAALLVLCLLGPPLLLGVVDLVDVFVSLYKIHRQFPQWGRAGVSVARLDPAPRHGNQVPSVRAGAGVVEAHHLWEEVVGLAAQGGYHGVGVLYGEGQQGSRSVLIQNGAGVLRLGVGRTQVLRWGGAEVDQLVLRQPGVQVRHGGAAAAAVHVQRGELRAGERQRPLQDELGAGVGVPTLGHILYDHTACRNGRQFLHD